MKSDINSTAEEKNVVRVLLVMHGAGSGGVETSLGTLCKYLDREQVRLTVAAPKEGTFIKRVKAYGIDVLKTHIEWWTPASYEYGERHYYRFLSTLNNRVRNLARIIRENNIDVVHSSTLTVIDGAIAAKVTGKPHIWNMRGKFTLDGPAEGRFLSNYLSLDLLYAIVNDLSTRIVANCQTVFDFLSAYIPPENMEVIHNGIDLEKFDNLGSASILDEFPSINGKLKVGFIGGFSKNKGTEDYVNAAISILNKDRNFVFFLVGREKDKSLARKIYRKIEGAGLKESIIVTGKRDDIPLIMNSVDLLICSSFSEGLPNSVMEAMAASKAVIATRCGGTEELILHNETGFLIDVGKPEELDKAILEITENKDRLKAMGIKGHERIKNIFSGQRCAKKYEALYVKLKQSDQTKRHSSPYGKLALILLSNLGNLGTRILSQERDIRDLRRFESLFKNNFIYKASNTFVRKYIKRKA